KGSLNFGEYVFNLTMKHADTFAIKVPIAFPSLISEIILSQHPDILHPGEIENIVLPKKKDMAGTSGSLPKATKDKVIE
ncbi:envelope-like protein, partial [Trifolium medium]|nr:envelope-like protein [Trifolium medium]